MKRKIIIISLLAIIASLLVATVSNAAIQIKPGATTHTNVIISNSFQYCYDMRHPTSSLGNNNLDPHMSLNRDWGAVVYLGLSGYGTVRSSTGDTTSIDGTSYTTTTGNASGVLNLGKTTYTYTAGLLDYSSSLEPTTYTQNLYLNKNTKYVEIVGTGDNYTIEKTKGQAFSEIYGWWSTNKYTDMGSTSRVSTRLKLMAPSVQYLYGDSRSDVTYRPVIWN